MSFMSRFSKTNQDDVEKALAASLRKHDNEKFDALNRYFRHCEDIAGGETSKMADQLATDMAAVGKTSDDLRRDVQTLKEWCRLAGDYGSPNIHRDAETKLVAAQAAAKATVDELTAKLADAKRKLHEASWAVSDHGYKHAHRHRFFFDNVELLQYADGTSDLVREWKANIAEEAAKQERMDAIIAADEVARKQRRDAAIDAAEARRWW